VPAPIPASNPWNKNAPLNSFHNDLGFELELINGPDIGCSSNDLYSTSVQKTQKVELANVPLCPYFEVVGKLSFSKFLVILEVFF